jgi:formylglycine-generating enzyme required for sulfatase activity
LSKGISLELMPIPAGEFVMGQADGYADEQPRRVKVARPFFMGQFEITNEQFALFDPAHDSRFEPGDYIQFSPGERGWPVSRPRQPVVRISWHQAVAFCRWLSDRTGRTFTLPTETQWEYACRAGTNTAMWYGTCDADFSKFANLSDATHQSIDVFGWPDRARAIPPWRPADARYDDHSRVSAPVGSYRPNSWGLFDMHGNVAEWTLSEYRPHSGGTQPSPVGDSALAAQASSLRVVRGGSWYDVPIRCRSAFRQVYLADQPVYDVGFRVICEPTSDEQPVRPSALTDPVESSSTMALPQGAKTR